MIRNKNIVRIFIIPLILEKFQEKVIIHTPTKNVFESQAQI